MFFYLWYNFAINNSYKPFYRNSDLKINRYFALPQFKSRLIEASKHGKEIFYNEVRKLNNCYIARKEQGDISIKDIFSVFWNEFKEKYKARLNRSGLIESIESMISCHNFDKGYLYYECPNCNEFYMVGFSCHSRFCASCGQKYKNQRTVKVSEKCLDAPHRQFVFTIPEELRQYFRTYRGLLNILFSTASEALNAVLEKESPRLYKLDKRRLGYISFLHTFGRDLKFHPHLHILIAERYLNNKGELRKFDYFHFNYLRITFQNKLFHNIYIYLRDIVKNSKISKKVFKLCIELKKKYPDGYYFYGPKMVKSKDNDNIKDMKSLTNYVARYASHPAISERRILKFDIENRLITWCYDPHEDDDVENEEDKLGRQYITEDVFSFIERLIVHIPSKGFQQIRYYGFYSNKFKEKISDKSLFSDAQLTKMLDNTKWINGLKNSFGYDPTLCVCGSQMFLNYELSFYPSG